MRKLLVGLLMAAVGLALLWALARAAGASVPEFTRWIDSLGALGPLAYVAAYALATIALVPGSILTLAAGALFGIGPGTLYAFAGATLGAGCAFLVSRYLARARVERRLAGDPRFDRLDRAVGRHGMKVVFLLRLSPIFPFTILNYALGLSRVRLGDYLVASVGMLPGTMLYVYYGKVAGDVAAIAAGAPVARGTLYWTVAGLGLIATLVLTLYVARLAKRALAREEVDESTMARP